MACKLAGTLQDETGSKPFATYLAVDEPLQGTVFRQIGEKSNGTPYRENITVQCCI